MTQLFANNAASTVADNPLLIGATTLNLHTGDGAMFPSPTNHDFFMLTLTQAGSPETSWEIVKVTARSTDALTIVRAQEGTSAAAWAQGSKAELRITAGPIKKARNEYIYAEDYGVVGDYVYGTVGSGTDNTTALANAISAAYSEVTDGKGVYRELILPSGYIKTQPITLAQPIKIKGTGPQGSVLVLKTGSTSSLILMQTSSSGTDPYGTTGNPPGEIQLEFVRLTSEDGKSNSSTVHGIECRKGDFYLNLTLTDVAMWNMPGDGYNADVHSATVFNGYMQAYRLHPYNNGRNGITLGSAVDHYFYDLDCGVNDQHGVSLAGSDNIYFFGAEIYANAHNGVFTYSFVNASFYGGDIAGNLLTGLEVTSLSQADATLSFFGTRFNLNSNTNTGTYFDIAFDSGSNGPIRLVSCIFEQAHADNSANFISKNISFGTSNAFIIERDCQFINGGTVNGPNVTDVPSRIESVSKFNLLEPTNLCWAGDFGVNPAQRGTSFAAIAGSVVQTLDGWCGWGASGTSLTISKQTDAPAGFAGSLRAQRLSGNTSTANLNAVHLFESADFAPCVGKMVTLSFWGKAGANYSASAGGLNAVVVLGTGAADQGSASLFAQTWTNYTVSNYALVVITTAWTYYSYSFLVPATISAAAVTNAALDFYFTPVGTASTNDWFEIAGVKLEIGPRPTPYQFQPTERVLHRAKRYFEKSYNQGVAPGTSTIVGQSGLKLALGSLAGLYWSSGTNLALDIPFKVTKFQTPTITFYSPSTGTAGKAYDGSAAADVSASDYATGENGFQMTATPSSATETQLIMNAHWTAEAGL